MREKFWERFSLGELNAKEWEALCDGCAQCCLIRHVENNEVTVYGIACELLDIDNNRCHDYKNRLRRVPTCHKLTPNNVPQYNWLPDSCAYRRIHEGRPLADWHPLIAGHHYDMERKGVTVSHFAVPQHEVPKRRMQQHIIASWRL
ncbi:MAG TPA: YcgN family cysteine cluster protein [Alcanivoracaceae bacterium]|nr:YcgN family cysteine cluster protein [Alcanivoracaceae bacterium]